MSVTAQARADGAARVRVYIQYRREGQRLSEALAEGRKVRIGAFDLHAGEAVDIRADFDSPRVRVRSLRVLIEIENHDDGAVDVALDDLRFIEWLTPFRALDDAPAVAPGLLLDTLAGDCP